MPYSFEQDTSNGRGPNSERDTLVGTVLDDRYLIEERIATGGFGAIYRASLADGEVVALKILHPRLTGDPNMVARFRREGATLTRLHDPHTVTTFAVGETCGTLYIAMELLSGESLQARVQRDGALPWQTAVAIARAVCSSLAEAHALGVVHRDLKPANIHVETRGGAVDVVKVIDFGIVKIARGSSIDDGNELTYAGHMIGTYDYMSPEQIVGAVCHDASDIYSLGVVTYEMLTARRPFPKVTGPAAMMTALLTQTPLPPSLLSAIPAELDRIVMRCLEREPQDRFGSVIELARELDRLVMARNPLHDEITVVRPDWDSNLTIPDGERTWIDHDAGVVPDPAVAPRAVLEPSTRIAPARSIPLHATLPGVAVATDSRNPRDPTRSDGSGSPAAYPLAPPGWQSIPAQPWMPPSSPFGRLASGSRRQPPAWSYRLLWVAVAILCVAAIVLAVVC